MVQTNNNIKTTVNHKQLKITSSLKYIQFSLSKSNMTTEYQCFFFSLTTPKITFPIIGPPYQEQ